jgi:hypothetical protein
VFFTELTARGLYRALIKEEEGPIMKRIKIQLGLVLLAIAISLSGESGLAADRYKASGRMISIQQDGTVKIDGMVYAVDGLARIISWEGKQVSMREISLPARVSFEYEATEEGRVIKRLLEIPQ